MNILENRIYRALDTLTNFFLLNILWLLACVPIITIFPATAALFAVIRGWVRGTNSATFKPFFHYMRENFAQSLTIGLLWSVIGVILVVDFLFVQGMTSWVRVPLFVIFGAVLLAYLATAVFLFPVMVHFRCGWLQVIRNAFLIAFSSPGMTLMGLFTIALAGLAVVYVPFSILVIGSLTAYGIYLLCQRTFERVETAMNDKD